MKRNIRFICAKRETAPYRQTVILLIIRGLCIMNLVLYARRIYVQKCARS